MIILLCNHGLRAKSSECSTSGKPARKQAGQPCGVLIFNLRVERDVKTPLLSRALFLRRSLNMTIMSHDSPANSSSSPSGLFDMPPWMDLANFSVPPVPATYGYQNGKTAQICSKEEMIAQIRGDVDKKILLVWTPESSHLTPPEEIPWLDDAVRDREQAHFKQARFFAIIGAVPWILMVALSFSHQTSPIQSQAFILMLVALGIIPLIVSSWNLYRLRSFTSERMASRIPEARYAAWLGRLKASWTWAMVGCIGAVGAAQVLANLFFSFDAAHSTVAAAGIVKTAIRAGEWWRLLTGTLLHANVYHFLFNIAALVFLGKMLEVTFHRVYVPLVFILSALSGSMLSLVLLPDAASVGASGGIMGLLGTALVLGWKQRHSLPQRLRRNLVLGVLYTFGAGLLAFRVIDNPAHLGGFAAGAILGVIFTRRRQQSIPHRITPLVHYSGVAALGVFFLTAGISLYLILRQ